MGISHSRRSTGMALLGAVLLLTACGPNWRELAQRGSYLDASRKLQEQDGYSSKDYADFEGLLRSRTRGTVQVHAYGQAELTTKLGWLPPALRDGRAVILRTTVAISASPVPKIVADAAPSGSPLPGKTYGYTYYSACCNLAVWAKLNDRKPPALPPEPKALSTWGAVKAMVKHTGRAFAKLLSLGGGVLADITWLSTLGALDIPVGFRPSKVIRKISIGGSSGDSAKTLSSAERAKLERAKRKLEQAKRELKSLIELRRMMLDEQDAVLPLKRPKDAKKRRALAEKLVSKYGREAATKLTFEGPLPKRDQLTMLYIIGNKDGATQPKRLRISICWVFDRNSLADYRKRCQTLQAKLPPGPSFAARVNALFAQPVPLGDARLTP
jgi:hypothetical protein